MPDYQVIARKFRPQTFKDVFGQDAIVITLKHAIKFNRLAQAYLFCGSRGTGKTTLARLLAKALNCHQPTSDLEPCNQCSSCREITGGSSLDVLEIDGASHRGIEDIRQINETVGYAASGNYKIFIIDEVHMLTKEAFNALLKTLEEPPPRVKFFFATTEPHKVLPTILSRCQRFNLSRIPQNLIVSKLAFIAKQLEIEVEDDALRLLAQRAEGGLRDAESLLDQILAFEDGRITIDSVTTILGLMPREIFFEIDQAGKEGNFIKAFEIAQKVFSEGKDIAFFIEGLIDHLRLILLVKIAGVNSSFTVLTDSEKEKYLYAANLYSREQCLDLIEYLLESQSQLRTTAFGKTALEATLLHVMRSHFRLPIEQLVRHLSELEQLIANEKTGPEGAISSPIKTEVSKTNPAPHKPEAASMPPSAASQGHGSQKVPPQVLLKTMEAAASQEKKNAPTHTSSTTPTPSTVTSTTNSSNVVQPLNAFVSEDPHPSPADLGKKIKPSTASQHFLELSPKATPLSEVKDANPTPELASQNQQLPLHAYDNLMHFAAVELAGRLKKN